MKTLLPQGLNLGLQRGDQVYAVLVDAIIGGRIGPGTQLLIDELAQTLGVSVTPVREALARLESQGLVIKYPYQGSYVKRFSAREIQELYEVRAGLECLAVSLACSRITDDQLADLWELQRSGETALAQKAMDEYQKYNRRFHTAILTASGNSLLVKMMENISLQMQMTMAQTMKVPGRSDQAIKEHKELLKLLTKRDAEAAERLMKEHIFSALGDMLRDYELKP